MKSSLGALSIVAVFGCNTDHPLDLDLANEPAVVCGSSPDLPSPALRARAERVAELFAGGELRLDRSDLAAVDSAKRSRSLDRPIEAAIAATTRIEARLAATRAVASACTATFITNGSVSDSSVEVRARLSAVDKLCRSLSGKLGGGPVGARARVAAGLAESAPFWDGPVGRLRPKQEQLQTGQTDPWVAAREALGLIKKRVNELEAALVNRELTLARLARSIGQELPTSAGRKLAALLDAISTAERISAEFSAAVIMSTNECTRELEKAGAVWADRARQLDNVRSQLRGFGNRLQLTPSDQGR